MPFTCPSGPRGMRADPAGNRRPFGGRSPGWGLSLGGQRDEKGGPERWERGPGEVGKGVKRDVQGGLLGTKHSKDRASPPSPNVWHPWETPCGMAGSRGVSPPPGGPGHSEGSPQVSTGPYPSSSASPSAAAARAMRPASGRECKSRRRRHKAPGTLTHKSNTICTKTTCMNYKLHHKN